MENGKGKGYIRPRRYWSGFFTVLFTVGFLYLFFQSQSIFGGDAGDLASAVITRGIPHPPGYPLYTSLGILLQKYISIGTSAWRIGFLSSIPGIVTTILLYDLLCFITKKTWIALTVSISYSLLYPVWLYAIVVEVFALNNFFTLVLIWIAVHFLHKPSKKLLFLASFAFGIASSHHHIIVFALPMLMYAFFRTKAHITVRIKFKMMMYALCGFLPYVYTFVSASKHPTINWMGSPSLSSFIQLVTRSVYGTFQAGGSIGHEIPLRALSLLGFIHFFSRDYRIAGILFILLGFFYLFKTNRTLFMLVSIGLISYIFFLFYASFPLREQFTLGTFERFMLPLYLYLSIYLGFGILCFSLFLRWILKFFQGKKRQNFIFYLCIFILGLYPLGLFFLNSTKLGMLKFDMTAEKLGRDILATLPKNSVVLIATDTPLFNTQYVYFAENPRPDVKLIHFSKLFQDYYWRQLKDAYPMLRLPTSPDPKDRVLRFIEENGKAFPIFSKFTFSYPTKSWTPYGLLFRLTDASDAFSASEVARANDSLWDTYQDPAKGALATYPHLLLFDVRSVYAISRQEIGYYLAKRNLLTQAEKHFVASKRLNPEDKDSSIFLSQVYMLQNRCLDAQKEFAQIEAEDSLENKADYYYLMSIYSSVCKKDPHEATRYQNLYEDARRGKETPLKTL